VGALLRQVSREDTRTHTVGGMLRQDRTTFLAKLPSRRRRVEIRKYKRVVVIFADLVVFSCYSRFLV